MDSIYSTIFGAFFADYEHCDKAGRDTVGDYTIDTCLTIDQGWETAVWRGNGPIIIVGRYPSKESAIKGHEDWVEACRLSPMLAWSVQTDCYEEF